MAVGTPVLVGQSNTYVKDFRSTGKLKVAFSRNPKEFALPNYVQYKTVQRDSGYYLRINTEQAARLVGGTLNEFVWPDGADRPQNHDGTERFAFADYRTTRYNYGFTLGDKATEQADWDIVETEAAFHAQQAMTARTRSIISQLTTTGNWDSANTIAAASISGNSGAWDVSTTARQDIKRSINYAVRIIMQATLSKVRRRDLVLVMNPDTAMQIAECQELVDHVKQSTDALKQFRGDRDTYGEYGLPGTIYGIPVVIEDAVMVTSRRGASSVTRSFVMGTGGALLLSRPGGLDAPAGGPSFSTATVFLYEDMTVETQKDPVNRRTRGNVVDDFTGEITAPAAGFYFQDVVT